MHINWRISVAGVADKMIRDVREHPVIVLPFIFMSLFDLLVLVFLFLLARPPFLGVVEPLVRQLDGGAFVQYPSTLLLLPRLFGYSKTITGFAVGMMLTGVAIAMIYQAESETRPSWVFSVRRVLRKFSQFAALWGLTLVCMLALTQCIRYVSPFLSPLAVPLILGFAATLVLQMLFVFTVPTLIIENRKFVPAVRRSFLLLKQHLRETFLLVAIPNILILPLLYIYMNLPELVRRFSPEVILYVLITRIILVTLVNFAISTTATVLFLMHKGREKTASLLST
ncbi:MAG: hypothetical protein ACYC5N_10970 [Endomicrobiales bacterium]